MFERIKTTELYKTVYPWRFLVNYLKNDDMMLEETRAKLVTQKIYCIEGSKAEAAITAAGGVLNKNTSLSGGVYYCFGIMTRDGLKIYTPVRATASLKTLRNWDRQVRKFGYAGTRFMDDPM